MTEFEQVLMFDAVTRGVNLLGKWRRRWHELINLDTLDMYNGRRCVLAQLAPVLAPEVEPTYEEVAAIMFGSLGVRHEERHGFLIASVDPGGRTRSMPEIDRLYSELTGMWRAAILARRGVPYETPLTTPQRIKKYDER